MDFRLRRLGNTEGGKELTHRDSSPFNRSGLASLSDLATPVCQGVFSVLEERQAEFLSRANEFRSDDYKWANDPLHCWSRIWEYPYVYYHVTRYIKALPQGSQPVVADVGSGVTFFPFSLARLGLDVVCTDIDSVCAKDLARARKVVSHLPGDVRFRLITDKELPFEDEECTMLYSISVLEHISDFENTVREMARILVPGGLCFITCDLGLDSAGSAQLNIDQYQRLTSVIGKHFHLLWPEKTVHPVDVLTSRNSPNATRAGWVRIGARVAKQKVLKPILGRKAGPIRVTPLAVLGLALQKS